MAFGPLASFNDIQCSDGGSTIDDAAKSRIMSLACQRPSERGCAAETWTFSTFVTHLRTKVDPMSRTNFA
jgi:hypothetical protein